MALAVSTCQSCGMRASHDFSVISGLHKYSCCDNEWYFWGEGMCTHQWAECPVTLRPRCSKCHVFGDFHPCVSPAPFRSYAKDGEPSTRPSQPTTGMQVESHQPTQLRDETGISDLLEVFLAAGGWSPIDPEDLDPQHAVMAAHAAGPLQNVLNTFHGTSVLALSRLHCIVEEVQELCIAVSQRDRNAIADALADIAYIAFGTAVLYQIPLEQCIKEVHRSNMTKDFGDFRRPKKGKGYEPPNFDEVLRND